MFRMIRFSILAVAVLAASPLLAKLKYDVDAYVQDGLVVNFDGVRNAGADNAHDPSHNHTFMLFQTITLEMTRAMTGFV